MAEGNKDINITQIRKPQPQAQPPSGDQSGFKPRDRRAPTLTPYEIRQQLWQQTLHTLISKTRYLPEGYRSAGVELMPHNQQAPNTCLLACTISVSEAIKRKAGNPVTHDESQLAQQLSNLGLVERAGLNTLQRRAETVKFLQTKLGLTINDTPTREPAEMAQGIIEALFHRDMALINSAAHWVVIYGLRKTTPKDVQWLIMNPAVSVLEEITTPQLANRLVGDPTYSPSGTPGLGIRADLLYVLVPNVDFRINKMTRPG